MKELHYVDVLQVIRKAKIPLDNLADGHIITDRVYAPVKTKWVDGEFSSYLFERMPMYAPNKFDCEDFCWWAKNEITLAHHESTDKLVAIPFGWLVYEPDRKHSNVSYRPDGYHAINWFIGDRRGEPSVFFYEPQRPHTIALTSNEATSIRFMLL